MGHLFQSASLPAWNMNLLLTECRAISALILAAVLLWRGLKNRRLGGTRLKDLWNLGLGTVTPISVINPLQYSGPAGVMLTVLISNSPQLLVSFIYLIYNSLCTSVYTSKEWQSYATRRRALRVTSPEGEQRSTYWLQLPYCYSVPLLAASATLHWLVSQSIFLAQVTALGEDGQELPSQSISTCGYSNIGLVLMIGLGSLLLLAVLSLGLTKFNSNMPIAGSCSAAISAACHSPENDVDVALKEIQWGAVKDGAMKMETEGEDVDHCCLTSIAVTKPLEGEVYA